MNKKPVEINGINSERVLSGPKAEPIWVRCLMELILFFMSSDLSSSMSVGMDIFIILLFNQ